MTIAKKTAKKAAKKRTGSGPGTPDARGKREAVQKIPAPAATGTGDSKLQNGRSAGIGRAASSPDNSSSRPGVNTQLADRETAVVASTLSCSGWFPENEPDSFTIIHRGMQDLRSERRCILVG